MRILSVTYLDCSRTVWVVFEIVYFVVNPIAKRYGGGGAALLSPQPPLFSIVSGCRDVAMRAPLTYLPTLVVENCKIADFH